LSLLLSTAEKAPEQRLSYAVKNPNNRVEDTTQQT
jgi:hypothetical protein